MITKKELNKIPSEVELHVNGKRFKNGKELYDQMVEQQDLKEQKKKLKREKWLQMNPNAQLNEEDGNQENHKKRFDKFEEENSNEIEKNNNEEQSEEENNQDSYENEIPIFRGYYFFYLKFYYFYLILLFLFFSIYFIYFILFYLYFFIFFILFYLF